MHTPQQVGDEPLLLAQIAPTFINADRYQGALMAQKNQAECIIMDDGFQNPTLYKDLSFIVIVVGLIIVAIVFSFIPYTLSLMLC